MCGIFGLINYDGRQVSHEKIRLLADNMVHRGPDDEGIVGGSSWAIGMRRLSIIDLVGGHQPISNEDKTIHIVVNGEIYNYRELRNDLIKSGHKFSTESDVEVLVHLYEEYGYEAIHYLNGMFSFALFDSKKQILWIARDRIGIKPLYYAYRGDSFHFSSELTGLAKILEAQISIKSVVDYLGYSYVPAPETIYEGIHKLMPGQEMILVEGKSTLRSYWQCQISQEWNRGVDQAVEYLDELLKSAIKLQLISDVPLGIFLSGGVDSSAIASYAAELGGNIPLETFTIDFEEKQGRDAQFADQFSQDLKSNHHAITVSSEQQFDSLGELINFMDEPMSDSAIVPTYMLSKTAREKGMKVLLSGAGGDEIFGGYPRHLPGKRFSASWFSTLPQPTRSISAYLLGFLNRAHRIRFRKPSRNFAVNISGVNFEFLSAILRDSNEFSGLLSRIDCDFMNARAKNAYPLMELDLNNYLPNNVLSLTDKATMATSVEGRVPLLDHRIVEFAFSLPEKTNLLDKEQKGLFKRTLSSRLPSDLLYRQKEGFNAPIHRWVEKYPERIQSELLSSTSSFLSDIIDIRTIEKWISSPVLRKQSGSTLYSLFVLNKWINTQHKNNNEF